jgi:glycosyltransferase involved in cell wall biosynthesis
MNNKIKNVVLQANNKKKKLVIITNYWYPIIGGVSTHLTKLYNGFTRYSDYEMNVIFREGMSRRKNEISIPYKNKLFFSITCFLKLIKLKPDIINSHGPWFNNLPTIIYKFLRPKTTIVHTHHTDPMRFLKGTKKIIYEKILSKYDSNVFVSKYLMDRYSYYDIKSEKEYIYGAIEIVNIKKENVIKFKKMHHINRRDKIICYIGNFAWDLKSQGVDLLIKSLKNIKDKNFKLLIIGEGEYRTRSLALVKKLKLEERVIFTGNLRDVFTPLMGIDIYAHITFQDAFSNTVLEAMSMKIPVIASNHGVLKEMITNNHTGILTKNNEKDISESIIKLIADKNKIRKITNNAFNMIKVKFNWKNTIKQYTKLFEKNERHN